MEKNETLIKVFKILLDNPLVFRTGLCRWVLDVYLLDLITDEEYAIINQYIFKELYKIKPIKSLYCWEVGFLMYRINFINEQIKILENEKN